MDTTRRSGLLLHVSSLPGPYGRGDLGPEARRFVDFLAAAGQRVWQVLPLGPPGWGGSPYAAASAFAGDPGLLSLDDLVATGLLGPDDLAGAAFPPGRVSPEADAWRRARLERAYEAFRRDADAEERAAFAAFRAREDFWLEDAALFAALKEAHGGGAFWEAWPDRLARHRPRAVRRAREEYAPACEREAFWQYLFARQWEALREHARACGVEVFGDVPIFVARDSADVWARPELFELGPDGAPTAVAGVPPDDFSEDGQLWGNPLYDVRVHARTAYAWWIERFRRAFELFDLVRVDHFRGFAAWWAVPAGAATAREGAWRPGHGLPLFEAVAEELGLEHPRALPVVAEDLGVITEDVEELLAATGFPGMRILQFAFGEDDPAHPFLPENHPVRSVVYTGTHDNQTAAGWFAGLDPAARARVRARIGDADPAWGLVELALGSPAFLAVVPAQDVLGLGDEARLNTPGRAEGNWSWRLLPGQLGAPEAERLRAASAAHGRRTP
ncbi:MAG: 4-alpha-glucanotransferase [Planctomycetota bacterium]|nr:MAG: 4-alpha-glucanotransferase [Planctomycetota bacterium]